MRVLFLICCVMAVSHAYAMSIWPSVGAREAAGVIGGLCSCVTVSDHCEETSFWKGLTRETCETGSNYVFATCPAEIQPNTSFIMSRDCATACIENKCGGRLMMDWADCAGNFP